MADIHYSGGVSSDPYSHENGYDQGYDHATPAGVTDASRVTRLVNWAGALVSMGLVIGMGVWAFQLLVRDVADVPVIRALDGPMRVAPTDPGGSVAENQGLAVNRLAEGAEAAPVPDQLLLAPPPQDLATVDLTPVDLEVSEPVVEQAFENASAGLPDIDAEILPEVVTPEGTDALIARLLEEVTPLSDMDAPAIEEEYTGLGEPAVDLVARQDTVSISVPGVRRSPRPAMRPAGLAARARTPTSPAEEGIVVEGVTPASQGLELAVSQLEPGTRLVQLGAFDSPELARGEWERLAGSYPDFFLGRARVIEEATSGGRTFFRLRAHGFGDLAASRRFCAALNAQGAECIPVGVR